MSLTLWLSLMTNCGEEMPSAITAPAESMEVAETPVDLERKRVVQTLHKGLESPGESPFIYSMPGREYHLKLPAEAAVDDADIGMLKGEFLSLLANVQSNNFSSPKEEATHLLEMIRGFIETRMGADTEGMDLNELGQFTAPLGYLPVGSSAERDVLDVFEILGAEVLFVPSPQGLNSYPVIYLGKGMLEKEAFKQELGRTFSKNTGNSVDAIYIFTQSHDALTAFHQQEHLASAMEESTLHHEALHASVAELFPAFGASSSTAVFEVDEIAIQYPDGRISIGGRYDKGDLEELCARGNELAAHTSAAPFIHWVTMDPSLGKNALFTDFSMLLTADRAISRYPEITGATFGGLNFTVNTREIARTGMLTDEDRQHIGENMLRVCENRLQMIERGLKEAN